MRRRRRILVLGLVLAAVGVAVLLRRQAFAHNTAAFHDRYG